MMEKLGVSKEQLLEELRTDYNSLLERKFSLEKTASDASTDELEKQIGALAKRIDEVEKSDS